MFGPCAEKRRSLVSPGRMAMSGNFWSFTRRYVGHETWMPWTTSPVRPFW